MPKRWWIYPLLALGTLVTAALLLVGYAAAIVYPTLPSLEALTSYALRRLPSASSHSR